MQSLEDTKNCVYIPKDVLNFSYNEIIWNFLRTKETTIPPRNKYIAPNIKCLKPYVVNTLEKLGFWPEAYKNYVYFSIKERLKLSKNNILHVPQIWPIFIHRTKSDKKYHWDRRLRPDICIENINEILKKLNNDNVRFFETYYCDEEVLAIEYINNPISLYKALYKEKWNNKKLWV